MTKKILVIDNDEFLLARVKRNCLGRAEVQTANSVEAGLELFKHYTIFDTVILGMDRSMPRAAPALRAINKASPTSHVLVLAEPDGRKALEAKLKPGQVCCIVEKPIQVSAFCEAVIGSQNCCTRAA